MKFKPLEWESEKNDYSMDKVLQRITAKVEMKFKDGRWKICRQYTVYRGVKPELQNNWYLLILDNNGQKHEKLVKLKVESLEAGKVIAEHNYQKYMNEYYEGFKKYMIE